MKGTVFSVVKNNLGIYGTIKAGNKKYYYNTNGVTKGLYVRKGLWVDFDVIVQADGREKAINIKAIESRPSGVANELSALQRCDLAMTITETMGSNEFIAAATIPYILNRVGISDFREYSESIELFIVANFSEKFVFLKNFEYEGKLYPGIVAKKEWISTMQLRDENIFDKKELTDEDIESVSKQILEVCDKDGFLLGSAFPALLRNNGISNYKNYAESIESFIANYFGDFFTVLKSIEKNGKKYPTVIIKKESKGDFAQKEEVESADLEDGSISEIEIGNEEIINCALLDELYNEKKYYEFLQNIQVLGLSLDNIPEEYIEKAICSALNLLDIDSNESVLNLFQRELFFSRTGKDFIYKWKKNSGYQNTILVNCEKSSLVDVSIPEDVGLITKLINNACADTKVNNSFVSVASRFEACMDSLVFPLYMIRLCASISQKKLEKTIGEFCAFIKNTRTSTMSQRVNFLNMISMLEKSLSVIIGKTEEPLSKNTCTNILSVYFDLNYQDRIPEVISIICKDGENSIMTISDFLTNYEIWNKKQYADLFGKGISLRIIEKMCAYIWHQCRNQINLTDVVINMLAQVLVNSNQSVIDEIIRLHITQEYTQKEKIEMLINSFHYVIEKINMDNAWFALASYIESNVIDNISKDEDKLDLQSVRDIRNWRNIADLFLIKKIKEIGEISITNENEYLKLFQLFEGNTEKYRLLQKKYNDWYGQIHDWYSNASYSEIEGYLNDVYSKKIDYTFVFIYEFAKENDIQVANDFALKYVEALLRMKKFDKVIRFVNDIETLTNEEKRDVISQTVFNNFNEYGISEEAFLIFTEEFTISDAIISFEKNLLPNRFSQIIALIILYAKKGELLKSAYLYALYHDHAETGYTRLYSQYRSNFGRHISKFHDHYDVIIKAFNSLPYDDFVDFLEWSSLIIVPNFSEYSPRRDSFSFFIDEILKNPNDVLVWKRFIAHLYSHRDIESNKWLLCVSAIIVRNKFHAPNLGETRKIIIDILKSEELSKWPENLIYYTASYAVENDDDDLCEQLYEALSKNNFVDKTVYDNPWCTMTTKIAFFIDYCADRLRETSDPLYFNLLTLLKKDLSGSELVEFSSYSVNKVFLLNKICKYFIENKNQIEAVALLENSEIWKNLTFQEGELLNAVKMLYLSNDELIENNEKLFKTEADINRFKRDLADIIKEYPSQAALHKFDSVCLDNAHKLRIYSVVYGIFGNEHLYETCKYGFDALMTQGVEFEYMEFLKKCYVSQLFYNSTYEYFYKLWRYFRLLVIACWENTLLQSDEDILAIMNKYHHREMAMRLGYDRFKSALCKLAQDTSVSQSTKKKILYCLLTEKFDLICSKEHEVESSLNDTTKNLVGVLSSFLDFRDINLGLFNNFYYELSNAKVDRVYTLTKNLSKSFSKMLEIVINDGDTDTDIQIVKKYMDNTSTACVRNIIALDDEMYKQKEELYISILGARQLAFKIFDYIRASLVRGQLKFSTKRYKVLAEYLESLGYESAKAQYYHILGMEYALNEDIANLRLIVSMDGVFAGIPTEWEKENVNLIRFSYDDKGDKFRPTKSITYIGAGQSKKGKLSFVEELCDLFGLETINIEEDEIFYELEREYNDPEADVREKIISGLRLLQISDKYLDEKKKKLALDVGLLIASKDSFVSVDTKLRVIKDLFHNGELGGLQKQLLYESFLSFYRDLSLNHWIDEETTIADIVMSSGDSDGADEIRSLCDSIKEYVPGISSAEEYPSEDLYEQLKLIGYIGQSIYSVAIVRAVEKKKHQIENSVRLQVVIENAFEKGHRVIDDGYVYLCIKNIGCTSINVYEDAEIEVYLSTQNGAKYTPIRVEVSGIKELRPTWLTGCRVNIDKVVETLNEGELLDVKVLIHVNGRLVCAQNEHLIVDNPNHLNEMPEPVRNGYYVRLAVGDNEEDHKLFGRNDEKEDIKYAISTGKAVIFGPSRIGKSSLVNWIRHSYAREKGNVISILMGGEEGDGKENDYVKNINDKSPLLYDNNSAITEYLLVDMFLDGLRSKMIRNPKQRRASFPEEVLQDNCNVLSEVISILVDKQRSIVDRYYDVDYVLQEAGYEVWLLFDEFQQVVEKWQFVEDKEPTEFIEVCNCINERAISNIKFVFCGSDELLRQMVLVKSTSVWRKKIFGAATGVRIGHIKPVKEGETDEFFKMLVEDSAVQRPGLKYSPEAIDTINIYSDRVPLYAKEICNTVLEEIKRLCLMGKFGRTYIYSYDISVATQNLMDLQNYALSHSLDEEHKARIVQIYDAVTKGLEENTDKQYLWFMAKWFMENPTKEVFDFKKYLDKMGYQLIEGDTGIRDRLEIACVRGIISGNEEQGYAFSTPFYYSAFCGTVQNLRLNNIFIQEDSDVDGSLLEEKIPWLEEVMAIVNAQPKVDEHDIGKIINACQNKDELKAEIKELYGKGKEYHIGQGSTFIEENSGTSIGTQNIVQVNVQSITNTLNGILTSQGDSTARLSGIQALPRLVDYLPQIEDEQENSDISDAQISGAMDFYVADMEESIESSFEENEEKMIECWSVLGFDSKEALDEFISDYGISQCFFDSLQFAYQLDCLFTEGSIGEKASQIDYSPVTIMYCKLIESLLKEYHVLAYSDSLPSVESDLSYRKNGRRGKYMWGDIKKLTQYQKQKLTIGSFVFPIVNDDESEQHIVDLATNTPGKKADWHVHADFIKAIKDIRNPSAHGNKNHRITLEQLENVRRILIQEEGLKRLITIVKEKI